MPAADRARSNPCACCARPGHDLTIAYLNSNIAPADEYARRLATLRAWAADEQVPVVEGRLRPGRLGGERGTRRARRRTSPVRREARCRACYRLRFEEAAALAAEQGFDAVGTTLSVSPYQYTDVIREELERAASAAACGRCSRITARSTTRPRSAAGA